MRPTLKQKFRRAALLAAVIALTGCAVAKPRTDDPLEKYNRKVYAFNNAVDKVAIRPVAVGYRKITNPPVRRSISDFFTNIRMPITVANDLLQARPKKAMTASARFLVNLTLGLGGFFDPASRMGLPLDDTDFGITLARWGVPDGPYLVLPLIGPTTGRDVWHLPVDSYFFDPMSIYSRNQGRFDHGQQYLPSVLYLVTLRARAIDAESFLESAYDPYVFLRDAYLQQRTYQLYDGNPPASVIDQMQGLNDEGFDPDALLKQQQSWEKKHNETPGEDNTPTTPQPAPASSSGQPY
ncbi:MlaA family lipoprotein [Oleiagrimonas soli]|uniref:Phospholipid-binding lipoprotein MlaA n=1 Tax=Oleiagrimonas soli TaxID=1543381 RepID=A0A841KTN0_9GAMM|nr:VacJ family lipoprotein [Oleiagrimonas soli]MBB6185298.1 phospholipid-binding lipoprotein MlaA [Oleiagrimonas soli]